jgi:hypothetical protein
MRPARFETLAVDLLTAHPAVEAAAPLRDAGDARYPYGIALRLAAGTEFRWQVMAASAAGDSYARPETPVEGDPAPGVQAPEPPGPYSLADADSLLAHVLTAPRDSGSEFVSVQRRTGGLTITCHSGAMLYVRALPVPVGSRR